MSTVLYGSCLCGDVGYRVAGAPLRMVNAEAVVFVPVKHFRWTRGETQVVSYRLPGPGSFATAFCRRCGGDLPRASRGETLVVVPAAALDAPADAGTQPHVSVSETTGLVPPFA